MTNGDISFSSSSQLGKFAIFVGFFTYVKQQLLANETIHAMLNLCRQNPWIKN